MDDHLKEDIWSSALSRTNIFDNGTLISINRSSWVKMIVFDTREKVHEWNLIGFI